MSATPPPLPVPSRKRRKLIALSIAIAAVAIALAVFAYWRIGVEKEMQAELEKVRVAGLPASSIDLYDFCPDVPVEKNMAEIYEAAFKTMPPLNQTGTSKLLKLEIPLRTERLTEEQQKVFRALLQPHRPAMDLAIKAAGLEQSRFSLAYEDGLQVKLPHLTRLKELAVLFEIEGLLFAAAQDADQAAKTLPAILALSRALADEPILVSQLTANSIDAMVCRSAERMLATTALSDETMALLSRELAKRELTNRFASALITERAMYVDVYMEAFVDCDSVGRNLFPEEPATERKNVRTVSAFLNASGYYQRDLTRFLRAIETFITVANKGSEEYLAQKETLEALVNEAARHDPNVCAMLLSPFLKLGERSATYLATLRTARCALAIERWRLLHPGELPASLEVLVPEFLPVVPKDPYDGKALRYLKNGRGFVVYSIGPNRKDDQGAERRVTTVKNAKVLEKSDVTFTVER